jgi:hypothetical protein
MQTRALGDLVGVLALGPQGSADELQVGACDGGDDAAGPRSLPAFITTGTEDVLVHVAVPSTEASLDFVLGSLTERREVVGVRIEVVYDHVRKHVVRPRADRDQRIRTPGSPSTC